MSNIYFKKIDVGPIFVFHTQNSSMYEEMLSFGWTSRKKYFPIFTLAKQQCSSRLYTPSFCHTFSYFLNFWHIFSGFWPTFWSFGHTSSTFTHILKFSHTFSYFLMPCQFLHTFSCFLSILHTFLKFYTFSQHSDTKMKAIYVNRAYNTIWLKNFGYLSGTHVKLPNAFV